MRDEEHRKHALKVFNGYLDKMFPIETVKLSIEELDRLSAGGSGPFTYILRLDPSRPIKPRIWAIPNRNDSSLILYIGGSNADQKIVRPRELVKSCQSAVKIFAREGYAINDQSYGHTVAGAITTSLLEYGFTLDDCVLDIVHGERIANELEFLIGYEETYFHLPPWNGSRSGKSCYVG